jgi:hypothetical protein
MMRGATAFAASAAVAAGLLLAGCGSGQDTQTERQRPPVSGVNINSADNTIMLRNLAIEYAGTDGYESGASAPISLRIANVNESTVRLVSVTSDAGTVVLAGPGAVPSSAAASPPAPLPPSASPSGSASGSPSASRSGSASAAPSAPASPTAPPSPSGPPVNQQINIEIPTRGLAILDRDSPPYLLITGLREELKPGQSVMMTFRFDTGTEIMEIETEVPMAVPLTAPPRTPLDLEEHEG